MQSEKYVPEKGYHAVFWGDHKEPLEVEWGRESCFLKTVGAQACSMAQKRDTPGKGLVARPAKVCGDSRVQGDFGGRGFTWEQRRVAEGRTKIYHLSPPHLVRWVCGQVPGTVPWPMGPTRSLVRRIQGRTMGHGHNLPSARWPCFRAKHERALNPGGLTLNWNHFPGRF